MRIVVFLLTLLISISINAHDKNIIRVLAPISSHDAIAPGGLWVDTAPEYGAWSASSATQCQSYSPESSEIPAGVTFTQSGQDCSYTEARSVQNQEMNTSTGEVRAVGSPSSENRTVLTAPSSREKIGTNQDLNYSLVDNTLSTITSGSNFITFNGYRPSGSGSGLYARSTLPNGAKITELYYQKDANPVGYYIKLTLSNVTDSFGTDSAARSYLHTLVGNINFGGITINPLNSAVISKTGGKLGVYWVITAAQYQSISTENQVFKVVYGNL